MICDVALEGLPVTVLIDRSGLVGADGATHQGVFDLAYLRQIPGLTIASPRDVRQLREMIRLSASLDGPMAIRYAKDGDDMGPHLRDHAPMRVGTWEEMVGGTDAMILAVGRMVSVAMRVAMALMEKGISCGVIDARFIKPLDGAMLRSAAEKYGLLVTLEDNVISGGFGSAVNERLHDWGLTCDVLNLGVPDRFIEQGTVAQQMTDCGLDAQSIVSAVMKRLNRA
jgi:1-deoxy-D-xylulose-5-phosphate synthase